MSNLIAKIKADAKKSGGSKKKFFYVRENEKHRVRFLQEFDTGEIATFHDSFSEGVNVPCQKLFGRECDYCENDTLRTRDLYAWSVWDYDAAEVQILMYAVNNCSPLPALTDMYETYGTIMDRDYVISVHGKQKDKTFSVVPMDKVKFRNAKAKPFSHEKFLSLLDKAWPDSNAVGEEDDAESGNDYSGLKPSELYKLCANRDIECEKKKPANYYVGLLQEDDKAQDAWGSDEDEDSADDWGEDEEEAKDDEEWEEE